MPEADEQKRAMLDYERRKAPSEEGGVWFVWVIFALGLCVLFAMVAAMIFIK